LRTCINSNIWSLISTNWKEQDMGYSTILRYQLFVFTVHSRTCFQGFTIFFFRADSSYSIFFRNKRSCDTDKREYCNSWYLIK
jgi:hypothetical protein